MLFWLFVILTIIGAALWIIGKQDWWDEREKSKMHRWLWIHSENITITGIITFVISIAITIICLIVIICNYSTAPGFIADSDARYEALTYKIESTTCRDEFGFLSKEVIDEVQNWNEDLAYYKTMQHNFWLGIFIPNIYDHFEFIDYHSYVPLGGG